MAASGSASIAAKPTDISRQMAMTSEEAYAAHLRASRAACTCSEADFPAALDLMRSTAHALDMALHIEAMARIDTAKLRSEGSSLDVRSGKSMRRVAYSRRA